jgi:hypothetical protein
MRPSGSRHGNPRQPCMADSGLIDGRRHCHKGEWRDRVRCGVIRHSRRCNQQDRSGQRSWHVNPVVAQLSFGISRHARVKASAPDDVLRQERRRSMAARSFICRSRRLDPSRHYCPGRNEVADRVPLIACSTSGLGTTSIWWTGSTRPPAAHPALDPRPRPGAR